MGDRGVLPFKFGKAFPYYNWRPVCTILVSSVGNVDVDVALCQSSFLFCWPKPRTRFFSDQHQSTYNTAEFYMTSTFSLLPALFEFVVFTVIANCCRQRSNKVDFCSETDGLGSLSFHLHVFIFLEFIIIWSLYFHFQRVYHTWRDLRRAGAAAAVRRRRGHRYVVLLALQCHRQLVLVRSICMLSLFLADFFSVGVKLAWMNRHFELFSIRS
jgi:hypothetical protein